MKKKEKFLIFLLAFIMVTSCEKTNLLNEDSFGRTDDVIDQLNTPNSDAKVTICHINGKGEFHPIEISINAVPAHLNHGDYFPDADGDGYTCIGACIGTADDCDDNNFNVNPGVEEICDNDIDDNCNGEIDEGCLSIGDEYAGGIIFYLDNSGEHGLVAAPNDQGIKIWGCYWLIGASGTAVGTGASNTDLIVTSCSEPDIAARVCADLVLNSYDDWFLPSIDELYLMYSNLHLNGLGSFVNNWYWSSTERAWDIVWGIQFSSGVQASTGKMGPAYPVRAARAF